MSARPFIFICFFNFPNYWSINIVHINMLSLKSERRGSNVVLRANHSGILLESEKKNLLALKFRLSSKSIMHRNGHWISSIQIPQPKYVYFECRSFCWDISFNQRFLWFLEILRMAGVYVMRSMTPLSPSHRREQKRDERLTNSLRLTLMNGICLL